MAIALQHRPTSTSSPPAHEIIQVKQEGEKGGELSKGVRSVGSVGSVGSLFGYLARNPTHNFAHPKKGEIIVLV